MTAQPTLAPWITAEVAGLAAGDLSGRDQELYGWPLHRAVQAGEWAWLEAAVLAGYAPHVEGVEMAVRALTRQLQEEGQTLHLAGVDGDALNCTHFADELRRVAIACEEGITALEDVAVSILRTAPVDEGEANAADRRAARARTRRLSALSDQVRDL